MAARAGVSVAEVRDAYERLHDAHAIVLDPESRDVWMAHPFSAVPTAYRVRDRRAVVVCELHLGRLGICALLGRDGTVETECEDCGEPQSLAVRDGEVHGEGVAHFLVPAAHFWDDIGFT